MDDPLYEWTDFFNKENLDFINSIFSTIDNSGQVIKPNRKDVLQMLVLLPPNKIRVVIVGQSPYPDDNACGIPFVSRRGATPATLKVLMEELQSEHKKPSVGNPSNIIRYWVSQGVFIVNASPTTGISGPKYLQDHSVIWKEFMMRLFKYIGRDHLPVILMGKDAWSFRDSFPINSHIIETPHPVTRGNVKFQGCGCFREVNELFKAIGEPLIKWT